MSNSARKIAAAESRWEAAQLQAANAQRELDYAVAVFEKGKDELDEATIEVIMGQIKVQQEKIKEFLLRSQQVFVQTSLKHAGKKQNNA